MVSSNKKYLHFYFSCDFFVWRLLLLGMLFSFIRLLYNYVNDPAWSYNFADLNFFVLCLEPGCQSNCRICRRILRSNSSFPGDGIVSWFHNHSALANHRMASLLLCDYVVPLSPPLTQSVFLDGNCPRPFVYAFTVEKSVTWYRCDVNWKWNRNRWRRKSDKMEKTVVFMHKKPVLLSRGKQISIFHYNSNYQTKKLRQNAHVKLRSMQAHQNRS